MMLRFRAWIVAGCLAGLVPGVTQAQDYPARPVTLVAPAAPGGVIDRLCRILAQRMSNAWGQQVVVEQAPTIRSLRNTSPRHRRTATP